MKKNLIWFFVIIGVVAVGGAVLLPHFLMARSRGNSDRDCQMNLKNIGTALEMYSTDWAGHYPPSFAQLTPNYLRTFPECYLCDEGQGYKYLQGPGVGYNRGDVEKDIKPYQDYYILWCEGSGHQETYGRKPNFPQYDGIQGLIME